MANAVGRAGRVGGAGMLLVSLAFPAQGQIKAPAATLTKEMRIDGSQEDFSSLGGFAVNARGDIAMAFRQDGQIRIYDATGKRLAVVGRSGSGPGEFRQFFVRNWVGDTAWVYDYELRRHTFVTRDGKIVRTTPLERALDAGPLTKPSGNKLLGSFTPHARLANGSMLGIGSVPIEGSDGKRFRSAFLSYSASGAIKTIALLPETFPGRWERPFGPWPAVSVTENGTQVGQVITNDMRVEGATFTALRYAANGDTLMKVTLPYRGVAMSKGYIDSVVAQGVGIDRVRHVDPARVPPVYPPVEGMQVTTDGASWIVLRTTEKSRIAVLLNAAGAPVAQFPMAADSYIQRATATHLWFTETDADGVQSVVRYRVRCGTTSCK